MVLIPIVFIRIPMIMSLRQMTQYNHEKITALNNVRRVMMPVMIPHGRISLHQKLSTPLLRPHRRNDDEASQQFLDGSEHLRWGKLRDDLKLKRFSYRKIRDTETPRRTRRLPPIGGVFDKCNPYFLRGAG